VTEENRKERQAGYSVFAPDTNSTAIQKVTVTRNFGKEVTKCRHEKNSGEI